ncbi:hypothetical protein Gotur_022854 [Gossypium turneri]
MLTSPQGQKQNPPKSVRKVSPSESHKDLWLAVREGSLPDVDSALTLLKKTAGTVNCRNRFGLTPLHIATWRNHLPIIQRLLAAGADPDAKGGESGWSSLHRALHFGHLAVASVLLQSGASITLEDSNCRTPIDLLSGPVLKVFESGLDSVITPRQVTFGLGARRVKAIAAVKHHTVVATEVGEVFTWGSNRGKNSLVILAFGDHRR